VPNVRNNTTFFDTFMSQPYKILYLIAKVSLAVYGLTGKAKKRLTNVLTEQLIHNAT
jgi:hypothetical protein